MVSEGDIRSPGAASAESWATWQCHHETVAAVPMFEGRQRIDDSLRRQPLCSLAKDKGNTCLNVAYFNHCLYPSSKPLLASFCSNAHQAAIRESLRPPKPFILPCAAIADSRSKKLKMMLVRAPFSMLSGINVLNESRAIFESACREWRVSDPFCHLRNILRDGISYLVLRL